jgi:hypothetical protein
MWSFAFTATWHIYEDFYGAPSNEISSIALLQEIPMISLGAFGKSLAVR